MRPVARGHDELLVVRGRALLAIAALLVGALVWGAGRVQLEMADRARGRQVVAQLLLTSMLDQETGLRGYLLTGDTSFLAPYRAGARAYRAELTKARELVSGASAKTLAGSDAAAVAWSRAAAQGVADRRRSGSSPPPEGALERKRLMDAYRGANDDLQAAIERDRVHDADLVQMAWTGGALLVVLLMALAGDALVIRRGREDRRHKAEQFAFGEQLQRASDTRGASARLRDHLMATIPAREVTVLGVDPSLGLLEPWTPAEPGSVAERGAGARPGACLGLRGQTRHAWGPEDEKTCPLCGIAASWVRCDPLLIGGTHVGAIVVVHEAPLTRPDRRRLRDSIASGAPVLANLRNLERAEAEASTDALTGLPNRRAIEADLSRMLGVAHRAGRPLAVLMVDLDHFKRLNDEFGHDCGDEALALVGRALSGCLRASDVAGRLGGEEFLVLAPGIADPEALGEKLRAAIEAVRLGNGQGVTASIGYAVATDGDAGALLKAADGALYAAKRGGRNRVEGPPIPIV